MTGSKKGKKRSKLKKEQLLDQAPIDFDKFFLSFVKWKPEVIKCVMSYIRSDCLHIFLDCDALVPFILPYINKHVQIYEHPINITGPLVWKTFQLEYTKVIHLSMSKLKELMDKYKICPNEATIYVEDSVNFTIDRKGNIRKDPENEDEDDYAYRDRVQFYEKLDKWCLYHQEILGKVKNWRLEDKIYQRDGAKFLSKLNSYMNLMSIDVALPQFDNDVDPEAQKEILNCIPNSVSGLSFDMKDELTSFNFLRYSYLRKLECPIFYRDHINLIPPSVESLNIYVYGEAEVTFLDTDKVPPNLKQFTVGTGYGFPNIAILIKQMNKLEWFEYCHDSKITKLESLCLPHSNITSLVFQSCVFNDYSSIRKYKALKRLWILHSNFPRKLFVSVEDFPNLQEFIFLPRSMVYYNPRFCVEPPASENSSTVLDDRLVFPPNLGILQIDGDLTIKTLNLPKKLNALTLGSSRFPKGIRFKLPDSISLLQITGTTVKSMNGFHFPTNLKYLAICGNGLLKSMTNTNLKSLKHLYFVDFRGTTIANQDMPSETNKYKYNSFTAPIEDRGYGY